MRNLRMTMMVSLSILFITVTGCGKHASPHEITFQFFKEAWLNHDYDEAQTLTDNVKKKDIIQAVHRVPRDFRKDYDKKIKVAYRETQHHKNTRSFELYAAGYRQFVDLQLKKVSGKWKITQIKTESPDVDELAKKINRHKWKDQMVTKD